MENYNERFDRAGFCAAERNADRQRDVQQLYRASGSATLITRRTGRDAE